MEVFIAYGQASASECHLAFVKVKLYTVRKDSRQTLQINLIFRLGILRKSTNNITYFHDNRYLGRLVSRDKYTVSHLATVNLPSCPVPCIASLIATCLVLIGRNRYPFYSSGSCNWTIDLQLWFQTVFLFNLLLLLIVNCVIIIWLLPTFLLSWNSIWSLALGWCHSINLNVPWASRCEHNSLMISLALFKHYVSM